MERPAHPPLGKWLIAAGIAALGFDPVGWRVVAAMAGTLTVLVTYLIGLRLFGSVVVAGLSAALLALDGLAITMSRIAMLDVFLMLFVATAVWMLLLGHDRGEPRWRLLAGVAFGCAVATKWSGVLALGVAVVLVAAAEATAERPRAERARRLLTAVAVPLVVVPFVVYVASWTGWFANYERSETGRERCRAGSCAGGVIDLADAWIDEQVELFDFQRQLEATHQYRSSPQHWPLLSRPVLFYFERCDAVPATVSGGATNGGACVVAPGNRARILGLGSPAVWWPGVVALVVVAFVALRRRSWPALVIAGFAFGQYLPWFASWKPGFSFYLLPATPFVCLALGWVAWRTAARRRWLVLFALLVPALAAMVYFRPLWYGHETSVADQNERLWFDSWR